MGKLTIENQQIEKFVADNLYRLLEIGGGRTMDFVGELKALLIILDEKNIYKIEKQLNGSGLVKIQVLMADLCSEYAKEVLKQERLAGLLFAIKKGLESQLSFQLNWG